MSSTLTSTTSYRPLRSSPLAQSITLKTTEPEDCFAQTPKMSIIQTQFLARQARAKLSREASRPGHRLRHLVGHANLLDLLYQHLIEAERQQQQWFDAAIMANTREEEEEEESEQIGSLAVDEEEEYYDSSSDSDSESDSDYEYDDDVQMKSLASFNQSTLSTPSSPKASETSSSQTAVVEVHEVPEFDSEEDDETDDEGFYPLTRTHNHQPPALVDDFSSDEEDSHSNPPSPNLPAIESARPIPPMQAGLWEKESRRTSTTSYFDDHTHPSLQLADIGSDPHLESSLFSPLVDTY